MTSGPGPDVRESIGRLAEGLDRRGWTLALAESCTGGLLASWITAVPGSSAYFRGGGVLYSDASKTRVLGVPGDVLESHGAVSEPTARLLAEGALRVFESRIALSITGIAGPGGARPGKPVGTVVLALASPEGTQVWTCLFEGDRDRIRESSARHGLDRLVRWVEAARDPGSTSP